MIACRVIQLHGVRGSGLDEQVSWPMHLQHPCHCYNEHQASKGGVGFTVLVDLCSCCNDYVGGALADWEWAGEV